jgi:hypothetical protein
LTLTSLLGINLRLLKYEDDRGLQLAEKVWRSQGAPSEGPALADTIECCLERCTEEGIPYPAILLKRKKQIERGIWSPERGRDSSETKSPPIEGDATCPKCGGSGYVLIEGGLHARMCLCNKWMRGQNGQTVQ